MAFSLITLVSFPHPSTHHHSFIYSIFDTLEICRWQAHPHPEVFTLAFLLPYESLCPQYPHCLFLCCFQFSGSNVLGKTVSMRIHHNSSHFCHSLSPKYLSRLQSLHVLLLIWISSKYNISSIKSASVLFIITETGKFLENQSFWTINQIIYDEITYMFIYDLYMYEWIHK